MSVKELFKIEPMPRPDTPQCEALRSERYWSDTPTTDTQCTFRSRYVIDGKHYCARHAGKVALEKLMKMELDDGKAS